jgi:aryl-alcohol dehydrogenase-like predicted oxidoreductase
MKSRILGKDLEVSAIGLGCMGFCHASGAPTEKAEAIRAIRQAAGMGYSFFDTAECYTGVNADGSIAWMMCKKSWTVPIPGSRKPERLKGNAGGDLELSAQEILDIDAILDHMDLLVFGGSRQVKS